MKTYYFYFTGHYLTGTGIVTASSKKEAKNLANKMIIKEGLPLMNKITEKELIELDINKQNCIITFNGDY